MLVQLLVLSLLSVVLAIVCSSVEVIPLYSDDYEEVTDTITDFSLIADFQTFLYMLLFNAVGLGLFYIEDFYTACVFLVLFLMSVIDVKYKLMPNRFIFVLILSIALIYTQNDFMSIYEIGTRAMSAAVLFVALFLIAFFAEGQFGGADVKILTVLAFFLDVEGLTLMLILVAIMVLVSFAFVFFINRDVEIPLVPFITASCLITILFGETIYSIYTGGFSWSMQFLTLTRYTTN